MMYTLEELKRKNFAELKQIGDELNVFPEGDRRYRQTWIDAIVGVNSPLLQVLEVSPAEEVQAQEKQVLEVSPAEEVQAQEQQVLEVSPAEEVQAQEWVDTEPPNREDYEFREEYDEALKEWRTATNQEAPLESKFGRIVYPKPAEEPIAQAAKTSPGVDVDYIQAQLEEPLLESSPGACDCPFCGAQHGLFTTRDHMDRFVTRCLHCAYSRLKTYPGAIRTLAQESVLPSKPGGTFCKLAAKPTENSPGVKVHYVEDVLPDCVVCFDDKYIEDASGRFFKCVHCTEQKVSQIAIAQAAKTSPGVKPDQNPVLTGIALSDRFLATYPPYFGEVHCKAEVTGQLNLLEPDIEDEPPDPDDFESLDAFREAIARWDWEHPSSLDHFSDLLPSSVQNEPSSVQNELPLQVSLDSFCLWAHCPADWYEPAVLLELSKVSELSPTCESSITLDFFIPTFGSLGDRFNGSDEPPDTGIFARLPKPKPPKFPPQAVSWAQVNHKSTTSQPQVNHKSAQVSRHPETISKLFHRVAAGSSTQPARSPPGGDD
ncbi:hypothetical protein QUB56_27005 [Microcoleus sp. AR_TQ3_B6]|uniref:hypothetical protein n=1 Tax=Microcoleus sp. AR_TQ3_B6 TaxID=3055284 RepID=UPI002FD50EB4